MWKLEVITKDLIGGEYTILNKEYFEGFKDRRDAEEKIMEYYEHEQENSHIGYSFYLISPWGTMFPVDIFGTAYTNTLSNSFGIIE